jgi:predicted outer membrane repeat protein
MKKTVFLLILLCFIGFESGAQIVGSGTLANPYHGINNGDFTISGTKYFNGNLGVSAGTLRLMPGTKLICLTKYASIIISGTGQINAQGTAYSHITVTADLDLDGITGGSTDFWGNININSSGTSTFNYCTVECGRQTRFRYLGGAIYIGGGTVNIDNSIIRNCYANKGGGIYVDSGTAPSITNTLFLNNKASDNGGAIFIAEGAAPVLTSCLLRNNQSTSTILKGGSIAVLSASPVIVNSTVVYSESSAGDGTSIYLENSPDAKVINSVFWGGSSHIGLSGTPTSVFDYCAIEGADYPGCLNLSSNNTDADGPNFTDIDMGYFSIHFTSPLRDSGADNYTGVVIPPTDLLGSARIGPTDIGAYEMIYSRWQGGTTDWSAAGNWDGGFVPVSRNVVIPAGMPSYPVAGPGPAFTLNTGLRMIMEPGTQATFTSLTNNGTIELHADAAGMASLITGSYSGSGGNINVDVYLKGAPVGTDIWHYIAPPATVSKTVFTDIEPYNLLSYDESKVLTDVTEGWQWHDGYDGTTGFSNLEAKKGYNVLVSEDTVMVFSNLKSLTTTLGQINLPFSGSGGDTSLYGYSLLGNSLTCGINWDAVTVSDTNVKNAYYLQTENGEASYVDNVGTNGATAHLPPMQGFFVKTRASGTYLTIPNAAREHNTTPRFKSSSTAIPLVRLTLSSTTSSDEMVVRFEPEATMDFDGEFDAGKMFNPVIKSVKIFSVMREEVYSINSIPWPEKRTAIPLTVIIPEAGTFKIMRSQLQSTENYKITLTDRLAGKSIDLKSVSEYAFSAPAGKISDRFILTVIPPEKSFAAPVDNTGLTEEVIPGSLNIYSASGKVCILPQGTDWNGISGKVRIYDITGRMIIAANDERFNSGELMEFYPQATGGLLIVEVMAGPKRFLEKVVLTKEQ